MALAREDRDGAAQERTCIVTRAAGPPEGLIRFVRAPDGSVAPDIRRKLPGRGVWVTASARLVSEAARKGGFARGFKQPVAVAPTLAEDVEKLLEQDALQSLAIANKAGLATAGFAKVEAAVRGRAALALVEARDGGEDGREKLGRLFAHTSGDAGALVVLFDSSQLGLALGRAHVIHAALARGPAADAFLGRCRRLAQYRGVALDGTACG